MIGEFKFIGIYFNVGIIYGFLVINLLWLYKLLRGWWCIWWDVEFEMCDVNYAWSGMKKRVELKMCITKNIFWLCCDMTCDVL